MTLDPSRFIAYKPKLWEASGGFGHLILMPSNQKHIGTRTVLEIFEWLLFQYPKLDWSPMLCSIDSEKVV